MRIVERLSSPLATLAALAALLLWPPGAPAHPLGNFSINRYSALRIGTDTIHVRYIVDMAEIPAFQEIQASGLIPEPDHPSVRSFAQVKATALAERLTLVVNGRRVPLDAVSQSVLFPPGAGGLPTLKLGILYRARLEAASTVRIEYRDTNYAERAGWKEIVAVGGPGRRVVESSVPAEDRSAELTDYPTDLLSSPPQIVEAHVAAIPEALTSPKPRAPVSGAAAPRDVRRQRAAPARVPLQEERRVASGVITDETLGHEPFTVGPNRQASRGDAFTDLVATKQLGVGIVLFALVVAAGLGAFHALEPGHGKTVVAAYLVGARGTAWHALLLGLIVTVSHTAGVYLLGGVTLYAQRYVMPERLYPWIGLLSGLTVAGLGFFLFLRRYAGHDTHHHEHHHEHHQADHDGDEHGHGLHTHAHGHHHHHHVSPSGEVTLKELFALGVTGGIVPCPAALVVLLSALSLGRLAFGLVLITAFSVGLAAVLILIGLLMVYARHAMARFQGEGTLVTRWLPLASSAIMAVLGIWIAVRALTTAGVVQVPLL